MTTGTNLEFPADLPIPAELPTESAERRILSPDGMLFDVRVGQTDRKAFEDYRFPPYSPSQAFDLDYFWRVTLNRGAKWFATSAGRHWPRPEGQVAIARKFLAPPSWEYIHTGKAEGGYWQISGTFEVRGTGELPVDRPPVCADQAITAAVASTVEEVSMIALYVNDDTMPRPSTMQTNLHPMFRGPGASDASMNPTNFWIEYAMSWGGLQHGENDLNYFTLTRVGVAPQPPDYTGGSAAIFLLTLNEIPITGRSCMALCFQCPGSWESMAIFINSKLVEAAPGYHDIPIANALSGVTDWTTTVLLDGGTHNPVLPLSAAPSKICTAIVVLRNDYGLLSATYVPIEDFP